VCKTARKSAQTYQVDKTTASIQAKLTVAQLHLNKYLKLLSGNYVALCADLRYAILLH
jgi:hypothetical protein